MKNNDADFFFRFHLFRSRWAPTRLLIFQVCITPSFSITPSSFTWLLKRPRVARVVSIDRAYCAFLFLLHLISQEKGWVERCVYGDGKIRWIDEFFRPRQGFRSTVLEIDRWADGRRCRHHSWRLESMTRTCDHEQELDNCGPYSKKRGRRRMVKAKCNKAECQRK